MKVSIITEGFQDTGYGHLTRCLSLYQAFEERNITPAFYINGDGAAKAFVPNTNHKIVDWLTHPTKLLTDIKNSDILIIDSYLAGIEYYETFSKLSKISLYIDDNLRLDYPPGILLNGTINAETFPYKKKPGIDYLLGAQYTPIRKEFWNRTARKINQSISTLLITFGGQDVKSLTVPTLQALQENYSGLTKLVVVGNASQKRKELENIKDRHTNFYYSITASQMKELMLSSDVAISAAGQTLYELAVTGTPIIAVVVADNQKSNMLEWKKTGALQDTIFHSDHIYLKKIIDQLNYMKSVSTRKKLSSVGRKKIDGQGSRRVIKFLIDKFCEVDSFYLRTASENDSKIVFDLSNDPGVREQSINRSSIDWNNHKEWFSQKINEPNYLFLLAFDKEDNFIGQVRFQIEVNYSTVSISIVKEFRGKGLAKKILINACTAALSGRHNIQTIIAYIRPENTASIKGFESANFKYSGKEKINNEQFLKYLLVKAENENR